MLLMTLCASSMQAFHSSNMVSLHSILGNELWNELPTGAARCISCAVLESCITTACFGGGVLTELITSVIASFLQQIPGVDPTNTAACL
jgi:hypothetical protein